MGKLKVDKNSRVRKKSKSAQQVLRETKQLKDKSRRTKKVKDKKGKKNLKLSNTASGRVRRLSISSQRRKEKLQKAKCRWLKLKVISKLVKNRRLRIERKGKR